MRRFTSKYLLGILVFSLMVSLMTSLAYSKGGSFRGHEYKEGEMLVKFKPDVAVDRISSLVKSVGGKILFSAKNQKSFIIPNLVILKVDNKAKFSNALAALNANPAVEYADYNYKLYPTAIPNDPSFQDQWNMDNFGQTGGTAGADISAPGAWDNEIGSRSVVVATVDTGVDYNHQDLAGNMWVNQREVPGNGLDDDNNGYVDDVHGINVVNYCVGGASMAGDPMDDFGHGTHVAGIIGACGNNHTGVCGVNWKVSIMATKFIDGATGYGWTSDAIMCLNYILVEKQQYGVNIVATNNSWGGGPYSRALYDAIRAHQQAGILFIAAAGNDAMNNNSFMAYPASYDLMNIISVAATDHNDNLAYFSNWGDRTVDVAAPGVDILSTCSPLMPYCWSTDAWPYDTWSGTSMAAPHVAGLAALLKAQDQSRDWKTIRNIILTTGDTLPSLVGKCVTEKRINAERALTCAAGSRLFKVLNPYEAMDAHLYSPIDLEVHDLLCGDPSAGVTCTIGYDKITLLDDGVFPDKVAGDGVFSKRWTPQRVGSFSLIFKSESDGLTSTINITVGLLPPRYTIREIPDSFFDISADPGAVSLSMADEDLRIITSPFPVTIYGLNYTFLAVGDNGCVSYDSWMDWYNFPLPTHPLAGYGNIIAPFWDDLDPDSGGDVYYEVLGAAPNRSLIIQWNDIPHYNLYPSLNGVTFQVVFNENNPDIQYRYKDVSFGNPGYDHAQSATVGIQQDASNATQYSYNTPSLPNNYSMELVGSAYTYPQLSVEPAYVDFSFVKVGERKDQPVYLYNLGNTDLLIQSLNLSGSADYKLRSHVRGVSIHPGECLCVNIRYTPKDDQSDYASLTVKSNDGMCCISIYGCGLIASDIDVSEAMIHFGTVAINDYSEKDLTIYNKGNVPLMIDDIDIVAPFSIEGTLPPYTLAPGASLDLTLRFEPQNVGMFLQQMAIISNDPDESVVTIPLVGIGSTLWYPGP